MAEIKVEIKKCWPEKLGFFDKLILERYISGTKLGPEPTQLAVNAMAIMHVHNPSAKTQDYDACAFKTDQGTFYTGSATVMDNVDELISVLVDQPEQPAAVLLSFAVKQSKSNTMRQYMTTQLVGVVEENE